MTTKRRCKVCGRSFSPTRDWQVYDQPKCRKADFERRTLERLRAEIRKELTEEAASA